MNTIDKKSSVKFFLGVTTGMLLFMLTKSYVVLLFAIVLIGYIDKMDLHGKFGE